ncbi:hypothetical protein [Solilutibacter tolerans]|uniref:Outer membrane transport energization protein TonB n=1 Tax=Solilutibacter tolerans TaxID=1604334 RepID=A0A1N6S9F1_9GAMM|nr:hypothetical protein [Lysobacter tolerans]SIQ37748.1 outer membrane transport energization protein TonB [Lysobacter tolerans]
MGNGKFPLAMLMLALSAMSVGQDAMAQAAKPVTNGVELTKSESVLSMRVDGEMVVSPDGRVTEHRITTELPAEVLSLIDKNMAAWRFEPVKDQLGNPTHAKTYMRLTVVARKQGDGNYSALVENARFHDGEGRRGKSKSDKHALIDGKSGVRLVSKPRIDYPPLMLGNDVNGAALAQLLIAPDGSVEDVVIVQSALFNAKGDADILDKARAEMERNVLKAMKRTRYTFAPGTDLSEIRNRLGVIPVFFQMVGKKNDTDAGRRAGQWRIEERGPRRAPLWEVKEGIERVGISDVTGVEGFLPSRSSNLKPLSGVPTL